jgi:uncharacterized protein with FMN-binding domain
MRKIAMKKGYKIILAVLIFIMLAAAAGNIFYSRLERNLQALRDLPIQNINLSSFADGAYHGSYKEFPVAAEVLVTIKDHRITDIDLIKHSNGQGASAEIIPAKVVEAQALSVDIVSGATYSSKVILKAIENALTKDNGN